MAKRKQAFSGAAPPAATMVGIAPGRQFRPSTSTLASRIVKPAVKMKAGAGRAKSSISTPFETLLPAFAGTNARRPPVSTDAWTWRSS